MATRRRARHDYHHERRPAQVEPSGQPGPHSCSISRVRFRLKSFGGSISERGSRPMTKAFPTSLGGKFITPPAQFASVTAATTAGPGWSKWQPGKVTGP